jgi:hypothetical protein
MAQLKHVLAALLRDVAEAQDSSNRFTCELAAEYRRDPLLRELQVPNAVLSELELNLIFSVKDVNLAPGRAEQGLRAAGQVFDDHSKRLARAAIDQVVAIFEIGEDFAEDKTKWQQLAQNSQSDLFVSYLAASIAERLYARREMLLDEKNNLNRERASSEIVETLEEKLLDHPDLKFLFRTLSKARSEVRNMIGQAIKPRLDELEQDLKRPESLAVTYEADVIVAADELKELSDKAISQIRLKAQLQGNRWLLFQEQPELDGCLLPE